MVRLKNLKIVQDSEIQDWVEDIFKKNSFNMIDVSSKNETFRRALASGKIYVGREVFELIKNNKMPKGNPIALAEISAVLGVKKTSELIPLCHPLPIDHTATKIIMNEEEASLEVFCVVSATAKTGVEMEAIMGVNAALITIYDLSKIVNPNLKIDNIKLLIKEGGILFPRSTEKARPWACPTPWYGSCPIITTLVDSKLVSFKALNVLLASGYITFFWFFSLIKKFLRSCI